MIDGNPLLGRHQVHRAHDAVVVAEESGDVGVGGREGAEGAEQLDDHRPPAGAVVQVGHLEDPDARVPGQDPLEHLAGLRRGERVADVPPVGAADAHQELVGPDLERAEDRGVAQVHGLPAGDYPDPSQTLFGAFHVGTRVTRAGGLVRLRRRNGGCIRWPAAYNPVADAREAKCPMHE